MLVLSVQIDKFRNFTNKQVMTVDPGVTCLIGKNESGKTTILKALRRLNPANNRDTFDLTKDYPRRHLARDRRAHNLAEHVPVTATFTLEESDLDTLEDRWGVRPPAHARVEATRTYDDDLEVRIFCDLHRILDLVFDEASIDDQDDRTYLTEGHVSAAEVVAAAKTRSKGLKDEKKTARAKVIDKVPSELEKYELFLDSDLDDDQHEALTELLPKFFYFSTYQLLPGECDLHKLADRAKGNCLQHGDSTLLALLRLAGEGPTDFLDEDYDSRKAELQAANMELSEQVFEYWKQNDALTVVFDTDLVPTPPDSNTGEMQPYHRHLKIELRDERHGVETNFATRSTGFQWFFSFLAAFSAYRDRNERVVVLLDEPGTSLHGEAQSDFLRYIYGKLGTKQPRQTGCPSKEPTSRPCAC